MNVYSQPPAPGLSPYYIIDTDSDGFATFDIDYFLNTYIRNRALTVMDYNLEGYQLELYQSVADLTNSTNVIGASFTNTTPNGQYVYLKFI